MPVQDVRCRETMREDSGTDEVAPAIVDYKVKGSLISEEKANNDPQAGLYLGRRWLEGHPARDFSFAQIAKPDMQRKQMNASFVTTTRTPGQLRGALARIAQAASQIAACYERFGRDQPWGSPTPPAGNAPRASARRGDVVPADEDSDERLRASAA